MNPNNPVRQMVLAAFRSNPGASLQELVKATGYSQTTVYYHLSNLRNEGVITRENKPRGIYARRKCATAATIAKKVAGGKAARALQLKRTKKDTRLNERIELVVRMAKEKEMRGDALNATDVVMHSPIRLRGAQKVG